MNPEMQKAVPQNTFDFGAYEELRSKGLAKIVKMAGSPVIVQRQFDANTGDPAAPKITPITKVKLEELKTQLADVVTNVNSMITAVDAAQEVDLGLSPKE